MNEMPRVGEFAMGDPDVGTGSTVHELNTSVTGRDFRPGEQETFTMTTGPIIATGGALGTAKGAWANVMASHSRVPLMWGPTDVDRYLGDPKRIAFFMSRYKFAAKMLRRCKSIIDVGCGSGMGTLTFLSDTDANNVLGLDFEQEVIDHAVDHLLSAAAKVRDDTDKLEFVCREFSESPYVNFDGLCCLDVIEHLDPASANKFFGRARECLSSDGVAVFGTPSIHAAAYASKHSQIGHINLYDADRLHTELSRQFRHVFMFSANDEVIHTGFDRMAHYFMALCVK